MSSHFKIPLAIFWKKILNWVTSKYLDPITRLELPEVNFLHRSRVFPRINWSKKGSRRFSLSRERLLEAHLSLLLSTGYNMLNENFIF